MHCTRHISTNLYVSLNCVSECYTVMLHNNYVTYTVPQCSSTGSVRLVGGASSNEGRVEVCVNGMWGTVTYNGWDSREATVLCKQLGYQNPSE